MIDIKTIEELREICSVTKCEDCKVSAICDRIIANGKNRDYGGKDVFELIIIENRKEKLKKLLK